MSGYQENLRTGLLFANLVELVDTTTDSATYTIQDNLHVDRLVR